MSIDVQLVIRESYAACIVTGEYEIEEAKRAFTRLIKACAEADVHRLLLDIRPLRVTGSISFRERFDFSQHAAIAGIHARARGLIIKRTALLGTHAHIDPRRFGATVAANRGVTVLATTDEAEALAWLGVEPEEKADHESTTSGGS